MQKENQISKIKKLYVRCSMLDARRVSSIQYPESRIQYFAFCILIFDLILVGTAHPTSLISQSAQQLWQSRISVPQSEKDKKYRNELQRLIAQIHSIKFEPKDQELKPVPSLVTRDSGPVTRATSDGSVTAVLQEHTEKEMEFKPVSEKTLRMLESISQSAEGRNQLCKVFELAEILFRSSHLKQAAMFYQQALNRKDPNDIMSAEVRAWILFQIGNCLWFDFAHHPELVEGRGEDLPAAKKMYSQLITEYPNCPWTDLAKARQNLIDWYLNDKPQTLIAECKISERAN